MPTRERSVNTPVTCPLCRRPSARGSGSCASEVSLGPGLSGGAARSALGSSGRIGSICLICCPICCGVNGLARKASAPNFIASVESR